MEKEEGRRDGNKGLRVDEVIGGNGAQIAESRVPHLCMYIRHSL